MQHVPATTPIRRNRVAHVDSDRLLRRRNHLVGALVLDHGRSLPTRHMYAMRAAELQALEAELAARHVLPRDPARVRVQPVD